MDVERYESLKLTLENRVLTCALDRPDKLNALTRSMHRELELFFADLWEEEDIDVVVLTGEGRAFCVGGDLSGMDVPAPPGGVFTHGGVRIIRNLLTVPQPVIAAVNGDAIGLGATLALFSDIVCMSDTARIGDPHVNVGLVAGDGGAVIWPLLTSLNKAKELLFTGELLSAQAADELGIVNHVYEAESFREDVARLVDRIAKQPSYALRWTKVSLNKHLLEATNRVLDASLALEGLSASLPEHHEIIRRFKERSERHAKEVK